MKVSYSRAKGRVSSHCITWVYRKKRHRKFFRDRISAMRFLYQKETELGLKKDTKIENDSLEDFEGGYSFKDAFELPFMPSGSEDNSLN